MKAVPGSDLEKIRAAFAGRAPFIELESRAAGFAGKYEIFLVDHGRRSTSTHAYWWNHFEDACLVLGIPACRIRKDLADLPARRIGVRRIFLYFTGVSFPGDAAAKSAFFPDDIVCAFSADVFESFPGVFSFQIVFAGHKTPERMMAGTEHRRLVWHPYAPVHLVPAALALDARPSKDVAFFGTVSKTNKDAFDKILVPLARSRSFSYGGLSWRGFKLPYLKPLLYGFSPFLVDDRKALSILSSGRVNIVLHQDHHRRLGTLTERLFYSALLGSKIVCDMPAARSYYSEHDGVLVSPLGPDIADGDARAFLEACDAWLASGEPADRRARMMQKTVDHHTYLNTVVSFLSELDNALA